jgi:Flp pilus assembly protein CpaB
MTMTASRERATAPPRVESPAAARLEPPRWRDRRLVLGVVLILLAVLLGARLLATRSTTTAVLVAARPLAAGQSITAGDLRVAGVHLGGATSGYWPAADLDGLAGHPLTSAVAAGDLLPRSAVGTTADPHPTRVVSLPVDPARVPTLAAGDLVDVFATTKATSTTPGTTMAVLRGVRYLGGGDSGAGSTVSLRVEVPVDRTAAVVRASEVATLDVVLERPSGQDTGDVGATPLS